MSPWKLAWRLVKLTGLGGVIIAVVVVHSAARWAATHAGLLVTCTILLVMGLVLAGIALRAAGQSSLVTGMKITRRAAPALPSVRTWRPVGDLDEPGPMVEPPPPVAPAAN